ncbi:MAG TPA: M14 family zinc carboxypeptidase [Vicinamibacteria bacterium]|nr:M14 family zinc carboxypeptidase [Vicinamibacteria bacterium]
MTDSSCRALAYVTVFVLALSLAGLARAQSSYAPDTPEPGSVEEIARFTTDPRFVSPWVAYVPDSPTVPSPRDTLGHLAGAAGELASTSEIYGYFQELARTSPRVHVEVIGRTEENRDILLAAIADEEGIRSLDEIKQATALLADPRHTSPEQAEVILGGARPIYYFNAAIHADESVSPDMVMELAYRLAVSETPMIRNIREKLVVLINPVSNPDGRDKMVDWFERYLKGKNDYDALPRQSPPYWGKYVFVDANRDTHQQTQVSSQAVHRMFFDYHPTVVHDLHEAIPLLVTWNGTGPYNPNLDPIVLSEFLEMSFHEMSAMSAHGMPGVWTWNFGEAFGHHYLDSVAMNHNSIGRGYETFGNATAETVTRTINPRSTTREWYRPSPPPETVVWSHRDGVNYSETAALAILDYSAHQAERLLRNFYQKGYNSRQKGLAGNPYAFVVRDDQQDRRRVARLINRLQTQHIEVGRARAPFTVAEGTFPSGTFVIDLDQPYRNYAVDLLEPQQFPEDAEHEPYDDVSWALPVHYGVEVTRVDDAVIRNVSLDPLTGDVRVQGSVSGSGPVVLLADVGQEALLAARYRLAPFPVEIADEAFEVDGRDYPKGSWVLPPAEGLEAALLGVADELALDFRRVASFPDVKRHDAPPPRLGVWVPWADTDSIGWIRYTLDQQEIPYEYLRDGEIRAGGLKSKVDVIVYGTVLLDLQGQIHGIEAKEGPMPFQATAEFPSLGQPVSSDDITGGIGFGGLANLESFLDDGGVLVTLGTGSDLILQTGIVRNVRPSTASGISTPGAEIGARFARTDHPIAYGYSAEPSVFRSNYTVYDAPRRWLTMSYCTSCLNGPVDRRPIVLEWKGTLVSGGARNLEALDGRPAILDMPVGAGHALVYNFNPLHRDLNHSDHRLLWNGILNWNALPGL